MVKQNIVFVANKAGSLKQVTQILKEKNIDILGFACFDAPEFALFRMVCSDPESAEKALTEKGYMNRQTDVIAVELKDQVGSLDQLLTVISASNVSLDYIYTSLRKRNDCSVVILQAEDALVTESILKYNGFTVLGVNDDVPV